MKNKLSVLLLCITILGPALSNVGWLAYYEAYQGYITDNFCVNTDKPELTCNGKCYLSSKIVSSTEKSETTTIEEAIVSFLPTFIEPVETWLLCQEESASEPFIDSDQEGISSFRSDVFHPPKC